MAESFALSFSYRRSSWMGKPNASQRRASRGDINVYPAETSLGWRVIRTVSIIEAVERLAKGEWREVRDEQDNFLGCQVLANFKTDNELPSGASSTSITVRECQLNAGVLETRGGVLLAMKSRTAAMTEDQRVSRRRPKDGKPLPPEDAIERAMAKVREWPLMHGDKAVRVYPKVREERSA